MPGDEVFQDMRCRFISIISCHVYVPCDDIAYTVPSFYVANIPVHCVVIYIAFSRLFCPCIRLLLYLLQVRFVISLITFFPRVGTFFIDSDYWVYMLDWHEDVLFSSTSCSCMVQFRCISFMYRHLDINSASSFPSPAKCRQITKYSWTTMNVGSCGTVLSHLLLAWMCCC